MLVPQIRAQKDGAQSRDANTTCSSTESYIRVMPKIFKTKTTRNVKVSQDTSLTLGELTEEGS